MFMIFWHEYFTYEDGYRDVDGDTGYAVDHYERFDTLAEAQSALPHFLTLDENACVL
jgi:hypothetical protein